MGSSSSRGGREFTAEFLGTLFLVTAGSGMAAYTTLVSTPYALLAVAATFGTVLGMVIIVGGRISGTHINPAVSVAAVLAGHLRRTHFLPYIAAQLLGAVAAGIILWLSFPASPDSGYLGSTALATNIGNLVKTTPQSNVYGLILLYDEIIGHKLPLAALFALAVYALHLEGSSPFRALARGDKAIILLSSVPVGLGLAISFISAAEFLAVSVGMVFALPVYLRRKGISIHHTRIALYVLAVLVVALTFATFLSIALGVAYEVWPPRL
ncbi:MAG: aquaporin [Candidatus Geothermarchaeales archaeon]